ncbi:unnamed protein product, partial [Polarella glacialis]
AVRRPRAASLDFTAERAEEVAGALGAEVEAPARPRSVSESVIQEKEKEKAKVEDDTTVMLTNIPLKYNRTQLCERLAKHGFGFAIDFLYLPMSSTPDQNLGHALVNVRTQAACRDFFETFDGIPVKECFPEFSGDADAVCVMKISDIQGREKNRQILCNASNLGLWARQGEIWQPLFLDDYGRRMPLIERKAQSVTGGSMMEFSMAMALQQQHLQIQQHHMAMMQQQALKQAKPQLKEFCTRCGLKKDKGVTCKACQASTPEFVPAASPNLRADAKEFVPSMASLDLDE